MKKFKIIVLIFLICFITACSNDKSTYQTISPKEAYKELNSNSEIVLLDVRTVEEHLEENIPGSTIVPIDNLDKNIENIIKDKNIKIFVYCRSGNRSKTASLLLINLGYTNVYDLGGIINWPYEKGSLN